MGMGKPMKRDEAEPPDVAGKKAAVDQAAKDFMVSPSCDTFGALLSLHQDYKASDESEE